MQGHPIDMCAYRIVRTFRPAATNVPRKARGFTLVELMVVISIVAILVSVAAPSFQNFQERHRLEGLSAGLVTDIHYLRSEAVARNTGLRLSFGSDTGGTCYVLHTGGPEDCTCSSNGTAQCEDVSNSTIKSVGLTTALGVRLQANVSSMLFDPGRGTTTPAGSINLTGNSGNTIRQIINIAGRTRSCSPGGSVNGYKVC